MRFTVIPKQVPISIVKSKNSLSPNNYNEFEIPNKNVKTIQELLRGKVYNGKEIGSDNYYEVSNKYFVRTKALQSEYFTLADKNGAILPMKPKLFRNSHIVKGRILMSKDSNIGEAIYIDQDYPDHMSGSALLSMDFKISNKYVFCFIKNDFFKQQIKFKIGLGATIKHSKDTYLDCKIPLPNQDNDSEIIKYVDDLVSSVIQYENQIKENFNTILNRFDSEIMTGQSSVVVHTTYNRLMNSKRIDAGFHSQIMTDFESLIMSYKNGYIKFSDTGFSISRGQNLQVSTIGESIRSKVYHKNHYILALPTFISKYGTFENLEFLGSKNELTTIKKGDLVIGAEGFDKGRSIVIVDEIDNTITNIHGIIVESNGNLNQSIFFKCYLDYLKHKGVLDRIAVGGNGGSLGKRYWKHILIPKFPKNEKQSISKLYYNSEFVLDEAQPQTREDFIKKIKENLEGMGIIQLHKEKEKLKEKLDMIVFKIIEGTVVEITY